MAQSSEQMLTLGMTHKLRVGWQSIMDRDDPVLSRFRAALNFRYGDRVERVVLFGSRARGDARADSDYDVAVFLKGIEGFGKETRIIAEIESAILCDTGAVINALPLPAGSYLEHTGLMQELRRDGRDL